MSSFIAVHTGLETPLISAEEREDLVELVDEDDDEECIVFFGSTWDYCCLFFVMPTLLMVQFSVAFRVEPTILLNKHAVLFTIFLFVAAAYMYKTCVQQDHNEWMQQRSPSFQQVVLLTPEILMDVVLGVILVTSVGFGFEVLLYATMALATFVICSTGTTLVEEFCSRGGEDEKQCDYRNDCAMHC